MDTSDFLEEFLDVLEKTRIPYCIIGGQAVNAYVEPLVSLDLDVAVAVDDLGRLSAALKSPFKVETFPHSLNVSKPGSDLRIQIQTDERYSAFIRTAQPRDVLGRRMPVAAVQDVLQGKVWAASDPERRGSKRQKDLADIARILESFPALRKSVPEGILSRLI